jgi:hypothetical protein
MIDKDSLSLERVKILLFNWEMSKTNEVIEDRIENLFRDWRFSWLLLEWEMFEMAIKIQKETDEKIIYSYLDKLEKHIKNVDPHTKSLTINDEDAPVFFLTKNVIGY